MIVIMIIVTVIVIGINVIVIFFSRDRLQVFVLIGCQ